MKNIILLGGGGHCKSCIDVIEQENKYKIAGILDNEMLVGESVLDYDVIGTDNDISEFVTKGYEFLITVGQIETPSVRKSIFSLLRENSAMMATVISPRAYVSKYAEIGKGTIVMHDVMINVSASIGGNCIINSKALIEHDVTIEDFCHVSTAAVINGGVKVREGSFYGSNAVCREGVMIEKGGFIKAGSTFKGKK